MGFLVQLFHMVIRYNKGCTHIGRILGKFPPIHSFPILDIGVPIYDDWKKRYAIDPYFGNILIPLQQLMEVN